MVNRLVLGDTSVEERVDDLGERLRAAHAEMDGERIRGLSTEQRRLVDELAKAGFSEASKWPIRPPHCATTSSARCRPRSPIPTSRRDLAASPRPSAGPVSASSATPQWFSPPPGREKPTPKPAKPEPAKPDKEQPRDDKRVKARADLTAAERAKAEADDALSELQSDLATARLRKRDASRRLAGAEQGLTAAEDAYDEAKQASRDAATLVKDAKAKLRTIAK